MPTNRDINPAEDLSEAYPALRPLIFNEPIAKAFAEQEDAANFWKRIYQSSGNIALAFALSGSRSRVKPRLRTM